jgi:hypothetical protein
VKFLVTGLLLALLGCMAGCKAINQGDYRNQINNAANRTGIWLGAKKVYAHEFDEFAVGSLPPYCAPSFPPGAIESSGLTREDVDICFSRYSGLSPANRNYSKIISATYECLMNHGAAFVYYRCIDGTYDHTSIGFNPGARSVYVTTGALSCAKYTLR